MKIKRLKQWVRMITLWIQWYGPIEADSKMSELPYSLSSVKSKMFADRDGKVWELTHGE